MHHHSLNLFSIVEEDTESKTVTSDDLASSESFTSSEQPQSLLTQYGDSEPSSVMIASSNRTVSNDYHQQPLTNEDPLSPLQEDDEIFSDSPKPNRKMGVTTAVIEGTYIDIHNVDLFSWKGLV